MYTTHCIACPYIVYYIRMYSRQTTYLIPSIHSFWTERLDINHLELHKHYPYRTVFVGNPLNHRGGTSAGGCGVWYVYIYIYISIYTLYMYKNDVYIYTDVYIYIVYLYLYVYCFCFNVTNIAISIAVLQNVKITIPATTTNILQG